MKIIIAPDSFKESLSATQAANGIAKGFKQAFKNQIEIIKLPVADGGEGTVEAMVNATGGKVIPCLATGPIQEPVNAFYGVLGNTQTAVIEMAAACGLDLLTHEQRNPMLTTSRGLGELILAALDHGNKHIIIGLGGSATNDAGAGMLAALGARLLDQKGEPVPDGGGNLLDIHSIDLTQMDQRLKDITIEVACDVDNPLIGPNGATYIFGPQKGATPDMQKHLELCISHFGQLLELVTQKTVISLPGAGAAGGIGASLVAVLNATLKSGINIVLDTVNIDKHLIDCHLVITGEGRMDAQSIHGKAPMGVATYAKRKNVPVIAITGSIGEGYEAIYNTGIHAIFSIVPGISNLQDALKNAEKNIEHTAYDIAKTLSCGNQLLSRKQ